MDESRIEKFGLHPVEETQLPIEQLTPSDGLDGRQEEHDLVHDQEEVWLPVEDARKQVDIALSDTEKGFSDSLFAATDSYGDSSSDSVVTTPTDNFEKISKSLVRPAKESDLDRLVDIDLMMFEKAYGQDLPSREETRDMLQKRMQNVGSGGHMLVCEVDGEVNGFATYFRTNKTWDDFTTWEKITNEGTLNNVIEPEGRYAYVVNMTVTPKGSEVRAMQKIMANLFSFAMIENIKYGFFVSRIPQFTQWLSEQGVDYVVTPEEELDELAAVYVNHKVIGKRDRQEPYDYELRTYTRSGFDQGELVKGGFSDYESLNYGVTFRVPVPLADKPKPLRWMAAKTLSFMSRSTKMMDKLF